MQSPSNILEKKSLESYFLFYAVFGGLSSSVGSLLGKLSSAPDVSWLSSGCLIVSMIIFNTVGMMNFAKSLNLSTSSLKATLVCSATNYISTAFIGCIFLGEETPFLWWCGTMLIICGLIIISYQQMKSSKRDGSPSESRPRSNRGKKKKVDS